MELKTDYVLFRELVERQGIRKLYHFTDRDNLESIIRNGGLYSWADCEEKGIDICKPGGDAASRSLDSRDGLQRFVRLSFAKSHPMMYVAMNEGRISNPVILEIDPEVVWWKESKFADRNAVKRGAKIGGELQDLEAVHFDTVKAQSYFNLSEEDRSFFQAEVLVKNFIPLSFIKNIDSFGMVVPSKPQVLQYRSAYTAQITRNTPTAFIFLVDHSASMQKKTVLFGEEMTMAEAAARIVNRQINELVLRCIKSEEVRNYYDIAIIGYGERAYSCWNETLAGRDFVSPLELRDNPYKRIVVKEEKRTRKGIVVKEVEKVQWVEARHDGSWTHVHKAFEMAKGLLDRWMEKHHDKDCYPPTVINITDGEFNGASKAMVLQAANEIKSMFTNDGNVILFNIHFTSCKSDNEVVCPIEKSELGGDGYAESLFEMSSLLPLRYNEDIGKFLNDERQGRHVAMGVNADATTLIKLMDIGTPTNIIRNK